MFPNKRMPSGRSTDLQVNAFKQKLFDVWCMEPSKKGSLVKYKPYSMPLDYVPFSIWDLWVSQGPPAGENCHPIMKIEFLAPAARPIIPANGADPETMPASLAAIGFRTGASSAIAAQTGKFVSRLANSKAVQLQKQNAFVSPTSEYSSRKHETRMLNNQLIHLQYVADSDLSTSAQKSKATLAIYQLRLDAIASYDAAALGGKEQEVSQSQEISRSSTVVRAFDGEFSESSATPVIDSASDQTVISVVRQQYLAQVTSGQQRLDDKFKDCLADSSATTDVSNLGLSLLSSCLTPDVVTPTFEKHMGYHAYLQWLKWKHGLQNICVPSDGACLFESTLRCVKALVSFSGAVAYKPLPVLAYLCSDWSAITAESFRRHILMMMKSVLPCAFPALSARYYSSFEELILDEGENHGIVDHVLRDAGLPPETFVTTDRFFELMSSPSAYGNLSSLLAISVFCDVQIHVWIYGEDIPEIYGSPSSTHYISLVKKNRHDHFDVLKVCSEDTHVFEAHVRFNIVQDEKDKRERDATHEAARMKTLSQRQNAASRAISVDLLNRAADASDQFREKIRDDLRLAEEAVDKVAPASAQSLSCNLNADKTSAGVLGAVEKSAENESMVQSLDTAEVQCAVVQTSAEFVDSFLVSDPASAHYKSLVKELEPEAEDLTLHILNEKIKDVVSEFSEHARLTALLPKMKRDVDVVQVSESVGRGLIALKLFDPGDVRA